MYVGYNLQTSFQVEGGSNLKLKITWFQPMTFAEGLYSLRVPFVFPETILPLSTELAAVTKVKCTINTGTNDPVEVGTFGNPMKVCTSCLYKVKNSVFCTFYASMKSVDCLYY